jgi:hypothetical protein
MPRKAALSTGWAAPDIWLDAATKAVRRRTPAKGSALTPNSFMRARPRRPDHLIGIS